MAKVSKAEKKRAKAIGNLFGSSTIKRMSYDDEEGAMDVVFTGGEEYRYYKVPKWHYKGMLRSTSRGKYLEKNIKGVYPHVKVERV